MRTFSARNAVSVVTLVDPGRQRVDGCEHRRSGSVRVAVTVPLVAAGARAVSLCGRSAAARSRVGVFKLCEPKLLLRMSVRSMAGWTLAEGAGDVLLWPGGMADRTVTTCLLRAVLLCLLMRRLRSGSWRRPSTTGRWWGANRHLPPPRPQGSPTPLMRSASDERTSPQRCPARRERRRAAAL